MKDNEVKNGFKSEIYHFIKGAQKVKLTFLLSLPMIIYALHRFFLRFVRHKTGVTVKKWVLIPICVIFAAALIIIIKNIYDRIILRNSINRIVRSNGLKELEDDFTFGTMYLNKRLIIGNTYIIAKGSNRLFRLDELKGVYNDIRDTYNILTMILAGADDVVKTKIIKVEYKNKNFLHDRRICAIEVHKKYLSDIGDTKGYEQLTAIEKELWEKINKTNVKKGD